MRPQTIVTRLIESRLRVALWEDRDDDRACSWRACRTVREVCLEVDRPGDCATEGGRGVSRELEAAEPEACFARVVGHGDRVRACLERGDRNAVCGDELWSAFGVEACL